MPRCNQRRRRRVGRDGFLLVLVLRFVRADFPRGFALVRPFDLAGFDFRLRDVLGAFRALAGFFLDCGLADFLIARFAALTVAGRVARAPIVPPTTVPTGPARLPIIAPAAAPATGLGIGGIWISSDSDSSGIIFSFRVVRNQSKTDSRDKASSAACGFDRVQILPGRCYLAAANI